MSPGWPAPRSDRNARLTAMEATHRPAAETPVRLTPRARQELRPGEALVFDWVRLCCRGRGEPAAHEPPRGRGLPTVPAAVARSQGAGLRAPPRVSASGRAD